MRGIVVASLLGLILGAGQAGADEGSAPAGAQQQGGQQAADQSTLKVFKYTNRSGVTSFSDQPPVDRHYRVVEVNLSCYACNLKSTVNWHNTPLELAAFQTEISSAARRHNVDPALVRAVIHAESAFKADAKSKAGALGLMQLMPATASDMGVSNRLSPEENINGGVRYLAWLLQRTGGNTLLATAAYNAGPGAVERHKGIPPYEETETYVKRVRILYSRYRQALASASRSGQQLASGY